MDERTSNEPVIDPEEILEGIKTWVDIETPSHLGEEVNKLVDLVEKSIICDMQKSAFIIFIFSTSFLLQL